jgi:hypothetical protein
MTNKDYYIAIWEEMLRSLLGWPRARVLEWVDDFEQEVGEPFLDNPNDIFYHKSPQDWAVGLLIPRSLRDRLSPSEWLDLEARLLEALRDERYYWDVPIGTDWEPFKAKVEQVLSEYGASLPRYTGE